MSIMEQKMQDVIEGGLYAKEQYYNSMINNIKYIKPLLTFDNPYDFYIVQIIKRRKDGEHKKTSSILKEKYVMSIEYLEDRLPGWIEYAIEHNARIYINPNKRRMDKMGLRCLKKLTDYLVNEQYDAIPVLFQKTVGNYNDHKPKRWVVDIDFDENATHEDCDNLINLHVGIINEIQHGTDYTILAEFYTRNGYHIITEPFNMMEFRKRIDTTVHKNSPTLLFCS